jgi:replication initiation and membrane attachment protein DnaB
MIPIHPEAYKVCYSYVHFMTKGKMNEKFLAMVCKTVYEKGITTEEETVKHIKEWRNENKGRQFHK